MTHTSPPEAALGDSNKTQLPSGRSWKSPQSIAIAALVIGVIATAVAIAALFLPAQGNSFNDQQSAQAKTNVCAAYSTVGKAVFMKPVPPKPGDAVAEFRVASNERMALLGGGAYLRQTTAAEPAAPADLVKAVNSMGATLEQLGLDYLAGADKSVWQPLRKDLATETFQISKICGNNAKKK